MKKSLLTLALLSAFSASAQAQNSSVDIYGVVDSGITYSSQVQNKHSVSGSNTSKFEVKSGGMQGSRIGFKGIENLGSGLKAIFNMEVGFVNDTGKLDSSEHSVFFNRRSVVGLNGNFGTVLLGRQTDFADSINQYTGVSDFGNFISNVGFGLSRLEGALTNNSISYTTNNLNGFTGNLVYGLGETVGKVFSGQAFGVGGKYENGPFGFGVNYYHAREGENSSDARLTLYPGDRNSEQALNVVVSYQFGPARIYGNWSKIKRAINTDGLLPSLTNTNRTEEASLWKSSRVETYELGTAYSVKSNFKLLVGVQHTRASFDGLDGEGRLTQINLGADYWLSERTDLYAVLSSLHADNMLNPGVMGDKNSTGSDISQTNLGFGIRHKF